MRARFRSNSREKVDAEESSFTQGSKRVVAWCGDGSVHSALSAIAAGGEYRAAFDETKPERDALDASELVARNIDVSAAVATALAAYPIILNYRAQIVTNIKDFKVAKLDAIATYARALMYAQGMLATATQPGDLVDRYAEALTLRETLTNDLKGLILRKAIDPAALADVNTASGYKNVADGLNALCAIAETNWPAMAKTPVTVGELQHARNLAEQLMTLAITRDNAEPIGAMADAQVRAATLLFDAYEETSSAIAYVRRKEGDASEITPTLYANRTGRRKASATGAAPVVTAPPVTTAPVVTTPIATPTPAPAPVVESPQAPGASPSNGASPTDASSPTLVQSTMLNGAGANGANGGAHSPMFKAPTL